MKLIVPSEQEIDIKSWPTLGPAVARWIESNLVFGPGDLKGQPAKLDDLKRAWLWIMYQVYPEGHPRAGRRRWKRCVVSIRKGTAKTEFAAWVAHAELHPEAPVRFHKWSKTGPVGRPVMDPFIPMVAVTEEQTDELAYGAVYSIANDAPKLSGVYDVGLERVARMDGNGKCAPFATSPGSADGARTTFEHFDETHHFLLPRFKKAHRTMLNNLPKRRGSDAWALETTTMFTPGEKSVAEEAFEQAHAVSEVRRKPVPGFFYFHLGADEDRTLETTDDLRAAVLEASGPTAAWSDIDAIVDEGERARTGDFPYWQRVWLNRRVRAADRAFDTGAWARRQLDGYMPKDGAPIALGFDGAQVEDSTALVATEIQTGFQWPLGIWERPHDAKDWHVPEERVDEAVADAFGRFKVFRMYADPFYWGNWINAWAGRYGANDHGVRVVNWPTNRWKKTADMVRAYHNAMQDTPEAIEVEPEPGEAPPVPLPDGTVQRLSHSGDAVLARHIGNAHKMLLHIKDKRGERIWTIQKERPDSPNKIDAAMAGALSWEARRDGITLGLGAPKAKPRITVFGGAHPS